MAKRKSVPGPSLEKVMKKKSPGSSVPKSVKKKSQDREILKRKSVALLAKTTKKKKVAPVVDPVEKPDVVMEAAPSVSRQSKGGILAAEYMPLDTTVRQRYVSKRGKKQSERRRQLIPVSDFSGTESAVIYVGRIPHGFYEDQMRGFFGQFGNIKRLRLSRNKKTGKSKHYAFIEFESHEVAPIVAEAMHNYLLFESMLQVKVLPPERINSRLWVGANRKFRTIEWQKLQREHHNRVRTPEEQARLLEALVKKDQKRRKKLQAAGIQYDYPEFKAIIPTSSKKIKFGDNDEDS